MGHCINLLIGKECLLGPLGGLPGCGHRHALVQVQVRLSEQVLLEIRVIEATEQEGEEDLLTLVIHGLTRGTADLHIALS